MTAILDAMPEPLHPFAFDPQANAWIPDRAAPSLDSPATITVITWNVWFAPYSFEARFRALFAEIHARSPDVVCLQEILPDSLDLLLAEPWVRARYRISDTRGDTFDSYGVVILSRLPVRALAIHELPSNMGRRLLTAEIDVGPHRLVVGTVHLESLKPNRELRAEQLREIFRRLKSMGPDSVLTGDFNFCSSWFEENRRIDPEFLDLWPALHGSAPGYTEDTDVNTMLWNHKRKEKQVRYDRILRRSARGRWKPRSIELLGTIPISAATPDLFPSDHFGLAAVLEVPAT